MRKAVKPFAREYKSRKPPQSAALFDEAMMLDEVPPRDINADFDEDLRYEAAMRAADNVFGVSRQEPAPKAQPEANTRIILTDLTYRDPLEERLVAASLVKRGRKLGSKNKPKASPVMNEEQPPPESQRSVDTAKITVARSPRRPRKQVGFIAILEARRATKPGERWKLKLPRRS